MDPYEEEVTEDLEAMVIQDASFTLSSAEEYFERVGYKFDEEGLVAEVIGDEGIILKRYEVTISLEEL